MKMVLSSCEVRYFGKYFVFFHTEILLSSSPWSCHSLLPSSPQPSSPAPAHFFQVIFSLLDLPFFICSPVSQQQSPVRPCTLTHQFPHHPSLPLYLQLSPVLVVLSAFVPLWFFFAPATWVLSPGSWKLTHRPVCKCDISHWKLLHCISLSCESACAVIRER